MLIVLPWPDKRLFWSKVDKRGLDECWPWLGAINSGGYGSFGVKRRVVSAHRVAALLSGMDPQGRHVCHTCDNPRCVNPRYLFLGSHADNMADKVAKGRQARGQSLSLAVSEATPRGDAHPFRVNPELAARGERSGMSKLTDEDVRKIRKDSRTSREIAKDYGVGKTTITNVKSGTSWRHVP